MVMIGDILAFIDSNFESGNTKIQISNLKKLVKYINDNELGLISFKNMALLIEKSQKLNTMLANIISLNEYSELLRDENISLLASIYASMHGIELKDDIDLDFAEKSTENVDEDDFKYYLNDIIQYKLLTAKEEVELFKRIKNGDEEARQTVINSNLRLVVSIAKKYTSSSLNILDLIQDGNLGLMRAIEKYDYTKGYKFSTYATWWIRQGITRGIAEKARVIRIPVYQYEIHNKMLRYNTEFQKLYGTEPTVDEIAEGLNLKKEAIETTMKIQEPLSLNYTYADSEEEEDGEFADVVYDNLPFEDRIIQKLSNQDLKRFIIDTDRLTEKEKLVTLYRYGFVDGRPWKLDEIGQKYNLSRERIRQIETTALKKLRFNRFINDLYSGKKIELDEKIVKKPALSLKRYYKSLENN